MKSVRRSDLIFLSLLSLVFLKLETYLTYKGLFAFTYDQGRDLLEAAKIAFDKNVPFIGPTTGLPGIFYGPWWYYFLSIPVFISKGDPTFVALVFSLIGLMTSIALFFFLRKVTGSLLISAFFSYISVASPMWMLSPTFIWSPTLVPISMILLFFSFLKIVKTQKTIYFFLYGLSTQIILNGEVAFGVMVTLWLILSVIIFRKDLFNRKLTVAFLGMLVLWIPQILFEIKNNFLEAKSVLSYLKEPRIYGEQEGILTRFLLRIDSLLGLLGESFFNGNKWIAALFILYLLAALYASSRKIKVDKYHKYLISYILCFLVFSILFFTVFQDRIWDYYLIGLPISVTILAAIVLNSSFKLPYLKFISIGILAIIFLTNIPIGIFDSFDETKATDGGAYINAKRVMDSIASQKPTNYSLYVYSPAIFDPPFDYLVYWYNKRGIIEKPKQAQDDFYLVIREQASKKYLNSGWYGDKTKDKSRIIERQEFVGDILLENHTF